MSKQTSGNKVFESTAADWQPQHANSAAQRRASPARTRLPSPPREDGDGLLRFENVGSDWQSAQIGSTNAPAVRADLAPRAAWAPTGFASSIVSDPALPSPLESTQEETGDSTQHSAEGPGVLGLARAPEPQLDPALQMQVATSELLREAAQEAAATPPPPPPGVPPSERAGVQEAIGVRILLDEDYAQLLSTPAKRQQVGREQASSGVGGQGLGWDVG